MPELFTHRPLPSMGGRCRMLRATALLACLGLASCTTQRLLDEDRMGHTIIIDGSGHEKGAYVEDGADVENEMLMDSDAPKMRGKLIQAEDPAPISESPKAIQRIRPGDEITILIHGQEGFDTIATVSSTGTIVMPLIGELSVSGLTPDALELQIRRRLASYLREDVMITLSVRNLQDEMVSVLGSVRNPSNYPVIGEAGLFEVLSMAGGTLEDADLGSIRIYRSQSPTTRTVIDINRTLEEGDLESDPLRILPGDIIMVPRKDNLIRELSFFLRDIVLLFGLFNTFR